MSIIKVFLVASLTAFSGLVFANTPSNTYIYNGSAWVPQTAAASGATTVTTSGAIDYIPATQNITVHEPIYGRRPRRQ